MAGNRRTESDIPGMQPDKGPHFGARIEASSQEPLTEMQKQHNKKRKKNH